MQFPVFLMFKGITSNFPQMPWKRSVISGSMAGKCWSQKELSAESNAIYAGITTWLLSNTSCCAIDDIVRIVMQNSLCYCLCNSRKKATPSNNQEKRWIYGNDKPGDDNWEMLTLQVLINKEKINLDNRVLPHLLSVTETSHLQSSTTTELYRNLVLPICWRNNHYTANAAQQHHCKHSKYETTVEYEVNRLTVRDLVSENK